METIKINYSDERLRILVEEYITQQRGAFTLKEYVLTCFTGRWKTIIR